MPQVPRPSPPPAADPATPIPGPTRPSPPTPGPTPIRPQQEAGHSQPSPTGSSAGFDFVTDPGPAFDPEAGPAEPELETIDRLEDLGWEEATIREALSTQGELLHELARWRLALDEEEAEDVWMHTDRDLRAIAPPLTRILNRYDVTRAAAVAGDEALLAAGIARYGARNVIKTRRLLAMQRARVQEVPSSGRAAEPGTGPEHDEDWQRVHDNDPLGGAPPALRPKGVR
jgi:hypothetical protein